MTPAVATALPDTALPCIDKAFIINLDSRPDRRREMRAELQRIGLEPEHPQIELFSAIRPENAGAFASVGARGCFLSHLAVLKRARSENCRAVLILEDDASFGSAFVSDWPDVLTDLAKTPWALAYLGYRIAPDHFPGPELAPSEHWRRLPPSVGVETTHAMLVHANALDPIISYLERMLRRPAGHPDGGPMHVDGAYSWFRRAHSNLTTYVTPCPYIEQRASASDITPRTWKNKLPFVAQLRHVKNSLNLRQARHP